MNKFFLVSALLFFLSSAALALSIDKPLADAAAEARARELFRDIRCVVCQGESVADSPAEVARDMRREIRAQVETGKSNAEIKAFLSSHYGDHILMRPPLNQTTWFLWFGPLLMFAFALALAGRYFKRHRLPPDAL